MAAKEEDDDVMEEENYDGWSRGFFCTTTVLIIALSMRAFGFHFATFTNKRTVQKSRADSTFNDNLHLHSQKSERRKNHN